MQPGQVTAAGAAAPDRLPGEDVFLASIAGYVDTLGFVALFGLFTAHVTGNFILIGSGLAGVGQGLLIKWLAFPAFIAGIVAARLLDHRMRVIPYDRNNPVQLYAAPGAALRIQLGADEEVVRIVVSDQATLVPEEDPPSAATVATTVNATVGSNAAPKGPASCDPNLCRDVMGNFVYLKPLRPLHPQPLFIQTKRCAADTGRCEMVPYTFELLTRPGDPKLAAPDAAWNVTFTYPERERAARVAERRKAHAARVADWRERQALQPAPPAAPKRDDNWHYGYRGSAAVQPDEAWDKQMRGKVKPSDWLIGLKIVFHKRYLRTAMLEASKPYF